MILVLLVVVLAVVAGAGLLGAGASAGATDRGGRRWGALAGLAAPAVVVVLLVVAALVVGGAGGGGPHETTERPQPTVQTQGTVPLPFARVDRVSADLPIVRIEPMDEDVFSASGPVSGLAPGSVVRVVAEGFEWRERGRIEHCVTELGRQTACAEAFPVQFDDDGRADVQFLLRGDVSPGACRVGQATCFLRLTGDGPRRVGTAQVVLDAWAPGRVRVEPSRALVDGQTVDVSVTGFPAGTTATAVLCAPPAAYDARRCAAAGAGATFTVDAAGAGRTMLAVRAGRLGADAIVCGPRRLCGVTVLVGPGFVAAPATPVEFSLGPGVEYEGRRLFAGIAVAVLLAAVAVGLVVRTDWKKPSEAASPALDGADLRAAWDLDELFGTEEELDERDPVPW